MNRLLVFAFLFFIGCVLGWGIELFFRRYISKNNPERKWINPGFLVGPWLPIYGLGLIGMYLISELLMEQKMTGIDWMNTVTILIIMTLVMTVIELIAGLIFTRFFNMKLWDYSSEKLNFKGVICPKYSLAWGIMGCFYYFVINPYVLDGIIWLSQHLTFSFFIGMFFGVFAVDLGYSFKLANKLRAFADENKIIIRYEELKAHLARQREEQKEKARFLLAFRTEEALQSQLERYRDALGKR
ncbi:MAG: hypothetical protein K6B42_00840 [Clostridia bacterium]|nr:hypothetical protein [Clostridia bacterium]